MAWYINQDGFFSVVNKDVETGELLVRARVLDDLKRLAVKLDIPATRIVTTTMADYHYRMTVNAKAFGQYLASMAEGIDYDNFKSSLPHATPADRVRARVYANVWSDLYQLQK